MALDLQSPLERPAMDAAPDSAAATSGGNSLKHINLLAYIHLRNIHASTGAGRVARQLTEHLALRSDIALRILADQHDQQRILPLVGEPWKSFDYSTFTSDTSRQQAQWFAFNSPRAESFWPEADIVFCTGESYVPTVKAKLVVTAHDAAYFEPTAHRRESSFWRQRLKWKLLFKRLSARADMIHTVSHFSAERLAHFFPSLSSRIRVVHNAVTPQFFLPVGLAGRSYLIDHDLSNRPYVLVPGGLHFRKNAELILATIPKLVQHFPDLLCVIAGHCDRLYSVRAGALGDRVLMTGFIEDTSLHALYANAAAVWFPSLYEGFGLPVVEAMASGAAVVASNASSIPEIAGSAALLASANDADDHLECLRTVLGDHNLCNRMQAEGRLHAAQFTWTRSADHLKQHFDQLL